MARYIDANIVTPAINDYFEPIDTEQPMTLTVEQIDEVIQNMPTADVVEVVRCKDCVKRRTPDCQMYWASDDCKEQYSWENDDDFCSAGERATEQEGAEQ